MENLEPDGSLLPNILDGGGFIRVLSEEAYVCDLSFRFLC